MIDQLFINQGRIIYMINMVTLSIFVCNKDFLFYVVDPRRGKLSGVCGQSEA